MFSFLIAAIIATSGPTASNENLFPSNRALSFDNVREAVNAGLLSWEHCKEGPTGRRVLTAKDFKTYIHHRDDVPIPDNRLITFGEMLQYRLLDHGCKSEN